MSSTARNAGLVLVEKEKYLNEGGAKTPLGFGIYYPESYAVEDDEKKKHRELYSACEIDCAFYIYDPEGKCTGAEDTKQQPDTQISTKDDLTKLPGAEHNLRGGIYVPEVSGGLHGLTFRRNGWDFSPKSPALSPAQPQVVSGPESTYASSAYQSRNPRPSYAGSTMPSTGGATYNIRAGTWVVNITLGADEGPTGSYMTPTGPGGSFVSHRIGEDPQSGAPSGGAPTGDGSTAPPSSAAEADPSAPIITGRRR